jgi:hypothetical protein
VYRVAHYVATSQVLRRRAMPLVVADVRGAIRDVLPN